MDYLEEYGVHPPAESYAIASPTDANPPMSTTSSTTATEVTVRKSPSRFLWLWAVVLFVAVYIALLLRYHYRHPKTMSILQCTATTFSSELLRERLPVVCSDFETTNTFETLAQPEWTPSSSADIFHNMQHFAPRFGQPQPIRLFTPPFSPSQTGATTSDTTDTGSASDSSVISVFDTERSLCEVRMLVQIRGESRVWLVCPQELERAGKEAVAKTSQAKVEHTTSDADYIEIVLRKGQAVFVPFLWGVQVVRDPNENEPSSLCADIGWRNWILEKVSAHRLLVS